MYNKFVLGISAFALAVGLAACSGDSDENADSTNEQPDQADEQTEEASVAQTNFDDIPDVIATINGVDLSKDEFVSQYNTAKQNQMMMGGAADPESTEVDEAIKDQTVDLLVNSELLVQASNEEDIEISDEEANEQLDQLKAVNQIESDEDLEAILSQQDTTVDEFREEIKESMKPQKYIEQKAQIEEPTDEEIEAKYDEFASATEEDVPELEEVRDDIVAQIKSEQTNEAAEGIINELKEQGEVEIFV
ncbi:SurA N-terminal domain-containing protein [Alkalicoccobacillus plakortidis]|uniref:SurA N-terminal domain-containing protein n=1 Tax=Alkalicoccobacillus plakortidis TaxID=444060 RepID=A0ABT0XHE5_9BACI|nr:SurA N-terminal domain-containing protein [Alkalicoccobacillus plakortidis]MCM2674622.1 SurA N-terminal domain-containing protein [Alkalicoccobacillus plakortidis]